MAVANPNTWILGNRGDGRMDMTVLPPVGTTYSAYPVIPGGFLHPFISGPQAITNAAARIQILAENPLDGSFLFYDGGAWRHVPGSQSGDISFTWRVNDYDAPGSGNFLEETFVETI